MSDSNLKLPATTELEVRVREALKVARMGIDLLEANRKTGRPNVAFGYAQSHFARIIRILEDGRS